MAEDSGANAINVLANDNDGPDVGETLTVTAVTQGTNGSVAITGGGTGVSYTPDANFNGADSFTYTINDGNGGTDTATVTSRLRRSTTRRPARTSRSRPTRTRPAAPTPDCSDVDGDTLTYSIVAQPADGSAAVVLGRLFSTRPQLQRLRLVHLRGQRRDRRQRHRHRVHHGYAGQRRADLRDVSITTDEDTTGSTAPDCSDVDGDTLTYSIVARRRRLGRGRPGPARVQPRPQLQRLRLVHLRGQRRDRRQQHRHVSITVTPVNDAPTCDDVSIDRPTRTPPAAPPPPICSDVDGDTLTYSIVAQRQPTARAVSRRGQLEHSPDLNFNGSDSFTYEAQRRDRRQQHGDRSHHGHARSTTRRPARTSRSRPTRTRPAAPRPTAPTSTATR